MLNDLLSLHTLSTFVLLLLFFVLIIVFSDDTLTHKLIAAALLLVCLFVGDSIGMTIYMSAQGTLAEATLPDFANNLEAYIAALLMCDLVIATLVYLLFVSWNAFVRGLRSSALLWFMIYPISQGLMLWWSAIIYTQIGYRGEMLLVFDLFVFIGLVADIVIAFMAKKYTRGIESEQKAQQAESLIRLQRTYYVRIMRDISDAAQIRHDIRNQLQTVYALMDSGEAELARAQLDKITGRLSSIEPICDNKIVDAIMREKAGICADNGIAFTHSIVIKNDCGIYGVDLCSLFSNIMDNAISAAVGLSKEKPGTDALITICAACRSGYVIVKCINDAAEPEKKKARTLTSEHGWVQTILKSIAEKYDGCFNTVYGDGKYTTTVTLKENAALPEETDKVTVAAASDA